MSNVMKAGPLAAINDRAAAFVSQCAQAGKKSVDVYVSFLVLYSRSSSISLIWDAGTAPLLRCRLCYSLYVQSRRSQVSQHFQRL